MIARIAFAVIAAAVCVSPGWAIESEEPLDTWLSDRIAGYRDKRPSPAIAGEVRSDLASVRTRLENEGMSTGIAEALTSPPELSLRRMSPRQAVEILDATRRRIDRFRERRSTTSPGGLENARGRLEQILSDPLFEANLETDRGLAERWARAAREWVYGIVYDVLDAIASVPGLGEAIAYLVLACCVLALGWLVVRWTRRPAAFRETPEPERSEQPTDDRSPERLLGLARSALGERDVNGAIRRAQDAAITALQSRGLITDRPGLTDLEGLAELRASGHTVREDFERVTRLHDRVVYGGRPADAGTVRDVLAVVERMLEARA